MLSMIEQSDIIRAISLPNAVRPLNCSNPWVPKNKLRLCLFAFGRAEVRVAFNDRAERYHSRNLVTERGARPLNSSNASGTQNKRFKIVYFGKAEVRVASTMTE